MPYEDWNHQYSMPVIQKNTTEIIKSVKDVGGIQIHIIIFYVELKPDFNEPPFTFINTIRIIVDDNIPESPTINKNGHFLIWEEDLESPLLMKKLIKRINSILC